MNILQFFGKMKYFKYFKYFAVFQKLLRMIGGKTLFWVNFYSSQFLSSSFGKNFVDSFSLLSLTFLHFSFTEYFWICLDTFKRFCIFVKKNCHFYIVIGNPMLRNDYFHGFFFKSVVYISSSKTGFSLWKVIKWMSNGFFYER